MVQSLLGSLCLVLHTMLDFMHSHVPSQELCVRRMTMEDAYQIKIMLQSRVPNSDSNFTVTRVALCATHKNIRVLCNRMHNPQEAM